MTRDLVEVFWFVYSVGQWVHGNDEDGNNLRSAVQAVVNQVKLANPESGGPVGTPPGQSGWVYIRGKVDELNTPPRLPSPVILFYKWQSSMFRAGYMAVWMQTPSGWSQV